MRRRFMLLALFCLSVFCEPHSSAATSCASRDTSSTWPPSCSGDLFPDRDSAYSLRWIGSFEHLGDKPDHLMSTNILDADRLVVASSYRLIVIGRNPTNNSLAQLSQFLTDRTLPSNLDGAPPPNESNFFHKFFNSATYGSYVYVATRYDPLYAFQVTGSGSGTKIQRRWMAPKSRVFTENLQVVKDKLYAVHHADGLEVFSLKNQSSPSSLATLKLTDSWGVAGRSDGNILVADGVAGLQWVHYDTAANSLVLRGGDTQDTSPGITFDVAFVARDTAITAIGGQGIALYHFNPTEPDETRRLVRTATSPLPGTCIDVEPITANQAVVACRNWIHVISYDSNTGLIKTLASAQMHRRLGRLPWPETASTNLASHVKASGNKIYVTAWDHVDEYQLVADADVPDLRLSTHRVHFARGPGTTNVTVANGGTATLNITAVRQSTSRDIVCTLDKMNILPGDTATLNVRYDGVAPVQDLVGCSLESDDPDDGQPAHSSVAVPVFADLVKYVDPGEAPPLFKGNALLRDYSTGLTSSTSIDLADYLDRNKTGARVIHFAVWGSW